MRDWRVVGKRVKARPCHTLPWPWFWHDGRVIECVRCGKRYVNDVHYDWADGGRRYWEVRDDGEV